MNTGNVKENPILIRLMDKLRKDLASRKVPTSSFLEMIVENDDGEVPMSFFAKIPEKDHEFFRKVLLKHDYTIEGYTPVQHDIEELSDSQKLCRDISELLDELKNCKERLANKDGNMYSILDVEVREFHSEDRKKLESILKSIAQLGRQLKNVYGDNAKTQYLEEEIDVSDLIENVSDNSDLAVFLNYDPEAVVNGVIERNQEKYGKNPNKLYDDVSEDVSENYCEMMERIGGQINGIVSKVEKVITHLELVKKSIE